MLNDLTGLIAMARARFVSKLPQCRALAALERLFGSITEIWPSFRSIKALSFAFYCANVCQMRPKAPDKNRQKPMTPALKPTI